MPFEVSEKPETTSQESIDQFGAERKLSGAQDIDTRPGTFRYSTTEGEVRTSVEQADSLQPIAKAEVFGRDGTIKPAGTLRYSVSGDEAKIYPASLTTADYGTQEALLKEVGQRAREQGATKMTVFAPVGDSSSVDQWTQHGFHRVEQNYNPAGIYLEKPL